MKEEGNCNLQLNSGYSSPDLNAGMPTTLPSLSSSSLMVSGAKRPPRRYRIDESLVMKTNCRGQLDSVNHHDAKPLKNIEATRKGRRPVEHLPPGRSLY